MAGSAGKIFGVRNTLAVAATGSLCLLLSATALSAMIADIWVDTLLVSSWHWTAVEIALPAGWLGFQIARLWFVWNEAVRIHAITSKDRSHNESARLKRAFVELFAYFVLTLLGLTIFALLCGSTLLGSAHGQVGSMVGPNGARDLLAFMVLFSASFIPLAIAFFLQAKSEARARRQAILRVDVVSPFALLVIGIIALFVLMIALAAYAKVIRASDDFGTIITSIVILVFLGIIVAPHVARHVNRDNEALDELRAALYSQSMVPRFSPAIWVSRIDSVLVRLVAPFSGATQLGWALPHALLCTIVLLLGALGYFLASPYGLVPIVIAMTIALALGRRWAWLEEDRETASRLQTTQGASIFIGFDNDLKDEALLGYAWLFVLVPLALNQIQDWTHSFTAVASASSGVPFVDWLRFFGAEIARAVPFVDVWETYNGDVTTPFSTNEPLAKHLVVVARMLVNLVIVSALIQAVGIWQRSRTQNKLYDAGQIDMFDPFTEAEFFDRGMQSFPNATSRPKKKFAERIRAHAASRKDLGYTPLPYNPRRLAELQLSETPDIRDGARWMIENFGVLAGSTRDRLRQLGPRWKFFELSDLLKEPTSAARSLVIDEKLQFERVISALEKEFTRLDAQDIGTLLRLLDIVRDSPDFIYGRTLTYELLGHQVSVEALVALSFHVLHETHLVARPTWGARTKAFDEPGRPLSFEDARLFRRKADERIRVYDALREIGINQDVKGDVCDLLLELLDWMGSEAGDKALASRKRAAECADAVRKSMAVSAT